MFMAGYFILLGAMLLGALFIEKARPLAVVLLASWAASFWAGLAGLGVMAPYIDGLAFYGLLVCTLKDPTTENIRCVWIGVALVAVHAAFNGASVFVTDWTVANRLAVGYMWSINLTFMAQVAVLFGGGNVKSIVGAFLSGVGGILRHSSGRRYASPAAPREDAAR